MTSEKMFKFSCAAQSVQSRNKIELPVLHIHSIAPIDATGFHLHSLQTRDLQVCQLVDRAINN